MIERRATFFICDDLLIALNGKLSISGMYTGDLVISSDQTVLTQLVILVQIETPIEKPFRYLRLQALFPGESGPKTLDAPQPIPAAIAVQGRTTAILRLPFLIPQPILRPGPIEVTIVHDEGEISAGEQWIITTSQLPQSQIQATH
jgi:hypothetical protein